MNLAINPGVQDTGFELMGLHNSLEDDLDIMNVQDETKYTGDRNNVGQMCWSVQHY